MTRRAIAPVVRSSKVVTTAVGLVSTLIALCLFVSCASTRVGKALDVGVGLSAGLDWHSTQVGEAHGGSEANPIVGHGAVRQALAKIIGASSVIGLASLAELEGKPILAHVFRSVATLTWTAIAIHNYQVTR